MELIIDNYGAKLKVDKGLFLVELENKKNFYSPLSINVILISEGVSLTSNAIKLAIENHIDVFLIDKFGKPFGMLWCEKSTNVKVRKKQLKYNDSYLAKKIAICKVLNQMYFLKSLFKSRNLNEDFSEFKRISNEIELISGKIDKTRDFIMGKEGYAAKLYFDFLSKIVPKGYNFFGRNMHPPKDKFNALLSYGYGFLYSEVEKSCILIGLDPYTGFLHSDKNGRFSLVLDLAELFKQVIVDRAIITLVSQKSLDDTDFEISDYVYLNKTGKRKLIEKLVERLETKIEYNERKLKLRQVIFEICHDLVDFFSENKEFNGFVYRW